MVNNGRWSNDHLFLGRNVAFCHFVDFLEISLVQRPVTVSHHADKFIVRHLMVVLQQIAAHVKTLIVEPSSVAVFTATPFVIIPRMRMFRLECIIARAMVYQMADEVVAFLHIFLDGELLIGVWLVIAARQVDAGRFNTIVSQCFHISHKAIAYTIAPRLAIRIIDKIARANVAPRYSRHHIAVAAPVYLYAEAAVGEKRHVRFARTCTSDFLAYEKGAFENIVLFQASKSDEDAILVIRTKAALFSRLWRISKDNAFAVDAGKVVRVEMLHLVHVCAKTRITFGVPFRDKEISGGILLHGSIGHIVFHVPLDKTSHLLFAHAR